MGNIFGEGFNPIITQQINIRQQIYGSGVNFSNNATNTSRTTSDYVYLNSTTSWCKLVSASNLKGSSNELAKKYVLFNGITDYSNNDASNMYENIRAGIDDPNIPSIAGAYGIGGTLHSGLAPMPGIISADIVHENRGSLRRAEVKIRAFNKEQFNIIDILYLRLGFSILLEWGHSSYFSYEDGDVKFNPDNSYTLVDEFLEGQYRYDVFLNKIQQYRLLSQGNYDAMFGRVANFSWSFLKDGTYDITLKLVSVGDVIESLKLNAISGGEELQAQAPDPDAPNLDIIRSYSTTNSIGRWLYLGADPSATPPTSSNVNPNVNANSGGVTLPDGRVVNLGSKKMNINIPGLSNQLNLAKNFDNFVLNAWSTLARKHTIKITYTSDLKDQYYVKLGALLQFIQTGTSAISPIIPTVFNSGGGASLLKFDPDSENTLMYIDTFQVSTDPRVCFIKKTVPTSYGDLEFKDDDDKAENIYKSAGNTLYAKIYNIYVNDVYIINTIKSNINSEGTISLYDFLKNILDGISLALGGLNKLDLVIDETKNTIHIVDNNPLPNNESLLEAQGLPTNATIFNLYGFKETFNYTKEDPSTNVGSLVKDFNFQTEISNELATMITVAAQYNGVVPGENPAAFSALNAGITDRYKTSISSATKGTNIEAERKSFQEALDVYIKFLQKLSFGIANATIAEVEANVGKYKDILQVYDHLKKIGAIKNAETNNKNNNTNNMSGVPTKLVADPLTGKQYVEFPPIPGITIDTSLLPTFRAVESNFTGFIPFNLQLTIDGLSGMKCIQKFLVDGEYLPRNYPNVVEFLIKGIQHQIVGNKWYTKLESYCIAKGKGSSNVTTPPSVPRSSPPPMVSGSGALRTDPSGFPVFGHIFSRARAVKNEIYLHHTAGPQRPDKGLQTLNGWNARRPGSLASSHAIIDSNGNIEYLIPDEMTAWCQGPDMNTNGLSVEILAYGGCFKGLIKEYYIDGSGKSRARFRNGDPDQWYNDYGGKMNASEIVKGVDDSLREIDYRGLKGYQRYLPAQITATENLIKYWSSKHNIPLKWDYNRIFPAAGVITVNKYMPLRDRAGLYSHCSCALNKTDIFPQKEMVQMLKRICTGGVATWTGGKPYS